MNRPALFQIAAALLLPLALASRAAALSSGAPAPATAPSAQASGSGAAPVGAQPMGVVGAPTKLSPYERNRLRVEFKRAQGNELRALEHRQAFELKDLKASQAVRRSEWEKRETGLRHKFFAEHDKAPDRRAYIAEFLVRRKGFKDLLDDERARRVQEQKVRVSSVKDDQAQRLREFEIYLQKGERPPATLWPQPGH